MQGQRLILFALFITVTHATIINFFDAQADVLSLGNHSTIYATHIELWTDVTGCPSTPCSCQVQTNTTNDEIFPIEFLSSPSNIGHVQIENLQPDTLYSFTLSCVGAFNIITQNIRTDYGRPSVPQNITVILHSKHLHVFWSLPLLPAGPISNYRLTINQNVVAEKLPNNILSYDMTEEYVSETQFTFIVQACNEDRRNLTVCSDANEGMVTFCMPMTMTTTITTTTKPNSSSSLSYSISFPMFIFCFLFFGKMKY